MKLVEITAVRRDPRQLAISRAEADFKSACRMIESSDWAGAREIAARLMPDRDALSPELAEAIQVMADILHPNNSPGETAEKIFRILPGAHFQLYGNKIGWNQSEMARLINY